MSDSEEEADGDAKMAGGKKKEKKVFENKNTVAKSKHENKRSMKDALKKIKTKRQTGTKIEVHKPAQAEAKIWAKGSKSS